MRIGVFAYGFAGERMTGIARYTVELTRALRRLDPSLEITLLNPYPECDHPWYREFPTYPLPSLKRLPLAATLGNWQLHRAALELELDVLHAPCGVAPFVVPGGSARCARGQRRTTRTQRSVWRTWRVSLARISGVRRTRDRSRDLGARCVRRPDFGSGRAERLRLASAAPVTGAWSILARRTGFDHRMLRLFDVENDATAEFL